MELINDVSKYREWACHYCKARKTIMKSMDEKTNERDWLKKRGL